MEKSGSFEVAFGLLCGVEATANVPLVLLPKNFKIFCAVGKKIKTRSVGLSCP
ncbi:MAG TPA: hypothetical protein PLB63_11510 [Planctomycetota bacterium]|jgi:hypothetical protein|nr:hypothetical protein [Planctomycetota bacterium]